MAVNAQFRRFVSEVRPESDHAPAMRAMPLQVINEAILSCKLANERRDALMAFEAAVLTVVHSLPPAPSRLSDVGVC
jgi:hypothetical protein